MKKIKYIGILALMTGFSLVSSCGEGIEDANVNNNSPEQVPTNTIFNHATEQYLSASRDAFNHGRLTLNWMEYWAQNSYADEDRYLYRETSASGLYNVAYLVATDLKTIIEYNTNEDTKTEAAALGDNDNQIAASRIMLAYIFHQHTNTFGDVPYWSYGSDDPEFEALQVDDILSPVFASQEKIYADILKELRESADMINVNAPVFSNGDNIFNGDATKWKRFANSLILRVATMLKEVDASTADAAITAAIADGVMTSNNDSAAQFYDNVGGNENPMWKAFIDRTDFGVSAPFVDLMKGVTGNFGPDPRLFSMAAPISASIQSIKDATYPASTNYSDYVGVPYAYGNVNRIGFDLYSFPSSDVLSPTFREVLMEYSEVEFLLSELNGFAQENYEKAVTASMEKWNVPAGDIATFVANLPPANEENVLNQKYVALYMQGHQAYAEFRRTGYPNSTILFLPDETYTLSPAQAAAAGEASYKFLSGVDGLNTLPSRLRYPVTSQTLNGENRAAAVSKLSDGDTVFSKLFWDVN
ncbi:SusD/RagB family nutrient-binding outer membrane lipoprotein [Gelidibacter pelagius]|uniref:SusD/RagB family nutrient-binding outer membrane lipoprotein n=1 Tax=Gelidibacter pelagius TaxID=2819985 RepID=A0ABS3SU48_9FLAO|nr:SusD/RagB family nutrient-binding outer membrane lipoprotein [Gelidibacter pelagius]MBO3098423.1 SusD/RagB family nutrient-binding outer membrane lipoprotein [Gelidibacter pelagius]